MALSQDEINQYRSKYGLDKPNSIPQNTGSNVEDRLSKLKSVADQAKDPRGSLVNHYSSKDEKPGFLKSLVQGVASPFARLGVEGYNVVSGANKALHGDLNGASAEFDKPRNLPFLGETKPTVTNSKNPGLKEGLDIAGQGIELGTDFAGVGAAKNVAEGAGKETIKQLVKQGAKEGAVIGGASGLGKSLQSEDASVGKTLVDTAAGTAIGGLAGGVTGGITGKLKGMPWDSVDAQTKKTWELIQPKLNVREQAQAVAKGKIKTSGILKTVEQVPKGDEVKMIEAAHPFVQAAKGDPVKAVGFMKQGIVDEAGKLRTGLDQSSAIWSQKNLKGVVSSIEKPHLLSGDLEKSFDKTLSVVLDKAKGADKKLSGLLDVRQAFDQEVEKQYPNLYNSESMTPIKQAVMATRKAINDLIESKLPNGATLDGIPFKASLKKQSLLYDAIENAATKADKLGSNIFTRAAKTKAGKAVQYGLEGFGAYEGAKKLLGK